MVQNNKVNFTAYRALVLQKTWGIKELVDGVLVNYDLTGKTVVFRAYDRGEIPNLLFELSPTSLGVGSITFDFSSINTDQSDLVDYLIVEDPLGVAQIIQNGTASFVPIGTLFPFNDLVSNETPAGLVIPENFITIKAYEWRLYLQNAIDPAISDVDVNNESAWPTLVNYLIAKLVVYDYIDKSLKSLIAQNSSGDESNAKGVKKIETGPSNAEFFDSIASLEGFYKMDKNGNSPLTTLATGICQLAQRLRIYLPICGKLSHKPILPEKACRPATDDEITILTKYFS